MLLFLERVQDRVEAALDSQREALHAEVVAVAIDHEAGKEIPFAVDEPVRRFDREQPFPERGGFVDALAEEGRVDGTVSARE
jgi:hypothetical protein